MTGHFLAITHHQTTIKHTSIFIFRTGLLLCIGTTNFNRKGFIKRRTLIVCLIHDTRYVDIKQMLVDSVQRLSKSQK